MSDRLRSTYRKLSAQEQAAVAAIKKSGHDFLNTLEEHSGFIDLRAYALTVTKIEEAVMWAVKGVTG